LVDAAKVRIIKLIPTYTAKYDIIRANKSKKSHSDEWLYGLV